jgi:hypothetical protein
MRAARATLFISLQAWDSRRSVEGRAMRLPANTSEKILRDPSPDSGAQNDRVFSADRTQKKAAAIADCRVQESSSLIKK